MVCAAGAYDIEDIEGMAFGVSDETIQPEPDPLEGLVEIVNSETGDIKLSECFIHKALRRFRFWLYKLIS